MVKTTAVVLFILAFASCGSQADLAYLTIQVRSPTGPQGSLRRFPPNTPLPERIQVQVFKVPAEEEGPLEDKLVDLDEAWENLEEDPSTQKKFLLVTVPSNADKGYTYLLRLASLIEEQVEPHDLYVDECGAIGQIVAEKGSKVRLTINTHLGDCDQLLCSHDRHCVDGRYCFSFECRDGAACTVDADCPDGAYCNDQSNCDSECTAGNSRCTGEATCCQGICSLHCPNQ